MFWSPTFATSRALLNASSRQRTRRTDLFSMWGRDWVSLAVLKIYRQTHEMSDASLIAWVSEIGSLPISPITEMNSASAPSIKWQTISTAFSANYQHVSHGHSIVVE
jgi:hypothetical protein